MAIFDVSRRTIVLKVVYYGCAMGGKTTNVITLHRLVDPEGHHGLVSIATKNDRTLFFDLLPMELGQVGGLTVRVKVYTVPGQVHYEVTRRQVLSGADGVVLVVDSDPRMLKANGWAMENLLHNLKQNRLDPNIVPIILQWNKRDLPDALPVSQLQVDLNRRDLPAFEAVATKGPGVVDTFEAVVTGAIGAAYAKAGKKPPAESEVRQTVTKALAAAKSRSGRLPQEVDDANDFDHRFDSDAYRDDWAEKGRDRQIVDQETLLSEAVQTGMELAERIDGQRDVQKLSERRQAMLAALGEVAGELLRADGPAFPPRLLERLAGASARQRASLLLFKADDSSMQEQEVLPRGPDPLNRLVSSSIGSAAHRLCQGESLRLVEDLVSEVFFQEAPAGSEDLVSCVVAPICCDRASFGAFLVYGLVDEPAFDSGEQAYWTTAARLTALSLHWRGIRRKLTGMTAAAALSPGSSGPRSLP